MADVVVLLHSSASSSRQWQALARALAPHARVHAVDLHGHGMQPGWQGRHAMTLADEAALALAFLEGGGGHVIGHSYGGAVALKLAAMRPELVRSVAVYEPVMFRWLIDDPALHPAAVEVLGVAAAIRRHLARDALVEAARRFVDYWSGAGAFDALAPQAQDAVARRMPAVRRHFEALFREPLLAASLARLPMPMLCLRGADTATPTRCIGDILRRALPDAEHTVVPGLGHLGPVTHAQKVNRALVQFVVRAMTPAAAA